MNYSKYKLAVCVPFDPLLHGMNHNSDKNICSHYFIYDIIEQHSFINNSQPTIEILTDLKHLYNAIVLNPHPIIRNYQEIMLSEKFLKFHIIQEDILDGGESVGYIKTFWLKLIQRKWKKIFKERKEKIRRMTDPRRLMKREITGKCY